MACSQPWRERRSGCAKRKMRRASGRLFSGVQGPPGAGPVVHLRMDYFQDILSPGVHHRFAILFCKCPFLRVRQNIEDDF